MKEEDKKERSREIRPDCAPIEACYERMPMESDIENGSDAPPKNKKNRRGHSYAPLYACVILSFLLSFVLMIGAVCFLSAPTDLSEEQGSVEALADADDKKVIWVHESSQAEGAMSTPELYEACRESVVSIRTEKDGSVGVGSGFVWREDGYIATASHVVEGCERIEVLLWDESRFSAKIVGSDTMTDLALLKINTKGLKAVTTGKSSELLAGERVVAIGTPASLDYAGSVCSGEVSCAMRTVKIYAQDSGVLEKKMKLIQMSAPVNPGNSGCPLFDSFGRVVGVVTMKLGQHYAGIGFAIPSDGATEILDAMLQGRALGDDLRGSVSVRAASLCAEGEAYEIDGTYGVRITGLEGKDSALRVGDMILSVGDATVSRASELEKILQAYEPGDCVAVTVLRSGQRLTFEISLSGRGQ